ncbi:MAG TPA: hypothetical protein VHE34_12560 [Puia sp.]|nr:hypothetical protein [Puia sp.]HVU96055.1 hypothetical protein [Puia sp.]
MANGDRSPEGAWRQRAQSVAAMPNPIKSLGGKGLGYSPVSVFILDQ